MELDERLSYLENVRDWQALVEELEKGIASPAANANKAQFHLRLGRVLETKFLAGVKALKHFQDAYKLNPALTESLEAARSVYWDLGKLNMVEKLLELELKAGAAGAHARNLLGELGDVFCDQGDWEKAAATYARSLGMSGGKSPDASACLADAQLEPATWQEHLAALVRQAETNEQPSDPYRKAAQDATNARAFLRAARIARRFAPGEAEGLLARAYAADASNRQLAALYEGAIADHGQFDALEKEQQQILQKMTDRKERAKLALAFGTRWVLRHQNIDIGARFLEEALKLDSDNEGAFFFLREAYGKKGGDWDRVLTIAEEAATRAQDGNNTFLLAQAGTIAWRQLGNLIRARLSFERLSALAPEHPQLRAFEAQIGESIKPGANDGAKRTPSIIPLPSVPPPRRNDVPTNDVASTPRHGSGGQVPSPAPPVVAHSRRRSPGAPAPAPIVSAPPPPVDAPVAAGQRREGGRAPRARRQAADSKALQRVREDTGSAGGSRSRRQREDRALRQGRRSLRLEVRQPGRGRKGL